MLKIMPVLLGSVVVLPATIFLLSQTGGQPDLTKPHDISAQTASQPRIKRPVPRPYAIPVVAPKRAISQNQPSPLPAETTQAADAAARELQALITQIMAGDGENADAKTQDSRASDNPALSNIVNTSHAEKPEPTPKDKAYVGILDGSNPPPIRLTEAVLYKVKAGDNLAKISFIHYGRAEDYVVIFRANRKTLDNPDAIVIGQKLIIPAH